jgi:GMP synthase-like glutamine amidotransferase
VRAIVIANGADNDGGVVGQLLSSHGYEIQQLSRDEEGDWPTGHESGDLVLSLGSDWSVYWPEIARFVDREAAFLRQAHDLGTPILGICFGAQMLAHCLGGRVEKAPQPEVGWFPVVWELPKGNIHADIERFRPLFSQNSWFQWHYDRFIAPAGADIWATSPAGTQTFSLQKSVGVQFHPEVTPAIVTRWASGAGADELLRIGINPASLIAETEVHFADSSGRAALLVEWFHAQVHKQW